MLTVTVTVIFVAFFATLLGSSRPVLGLDLQGGVSIRLFPVAGSDLSTLDTATQIIRNRVDGLGIAEPDVNRQGGTIVVDLPGVKDRRRAEDLVGATAELRFREVKGYLPWSNATASTTTLPTTTTTGKGAKTTSTTKPASSTTKGALGSRSINTQPIAVVRPAAGTATTTPATTPASTTPATTPGSTTPTQQTSSCQEGKLVTPRNKDTAANPQVILPDKPAKNGKHSLCYVLGPTLLTGKNIGKATKFLDPTNGWQVNVTFKNDDFVKKIAGPYVNKNVAIVLDGIVQSAPTINPGITGRNVTISGTFSEKEAGDLALALKYGSLPIQFDNNQRTVESVSPTLGKDQLRAGIIAGLIGLALVALYMIFFYRLLGLVVWFGLALTGMVFFSLLTYLSSHNGLTMTLAGVTGIIVSVGITVDSYVVFFERLKDEVRTGKTIRSSLESGWRRAWRTIIAADAVSLIGAAVLYLLTVGPVRNFALFLGISTLIDLALAAFYMHPAVLLMTRRPSLVRMPGFGIASGLDVPGVRA